MEIFLVGGAVRDFLFRTMNGQLSTVTDQARYWSTVEKDWVVVGSTPQEMLAMGYRQVGKSFPVFIHPETQAEYALARTERKTGPGYSGFECYAAKDVTLEADLKRRDLTINAIAMKVLAKDFSAYEIIDPYQGVLDLKNKILRHVSEAFAEDPVRVLRLARLATRFGDFKIAPDTQVLMGKMVQAGEVNALVPERVWQEWCRSLHESLPARFFEVLAICGASDILFPNVTLTTPIKHALARAVSHHAASQIRLAIELSAIGLNSLIALIKKYRFPSEYSELALLVAQFYPLLVDLNDQATAILTLFEKTDAFRRRQRFEYFLETGEYLGYPKAKTQKLREILTALEKVDKTQLLSQGLQGLAFAKALKKLRLKIITTVCLPPPTLSGEG